MDEQIIHILINTLYIVTVIQGIFFFIIFPRFLFFSSKQKQKQEAREGVSVVIAAKDEYLNLKNFLPKVLEQDYPDFEVIVVNNGSQDDSELLLKEMQTKYSNLKYINVHSNANFFKGKKFPLSIGIKSAKNEIILLTDADCYPATENWIRNIALEYDNNTEIVLGYGAYEARKGLLNKLIRFDTLRVAILYFSFAAWRMPYMGVGRNLSYRKSVFYKNNGFINHYKTASGDDDIFISQVSNGKNTSIVFDPEAKTISMPKESFREWFKQKRRHYTTGKFYKKYILVLLGLWELSSILILGITITLIIIKIDLYLALYILGIRTVLLTFFIKKSTFILKEKKLLLLSPLLEFLTLILGIIINMSNLLYKQRKWK